MVTNRKVYKDVLHLKYIIFEIKMKLRNELIAGILIAGITIVDAYLYGHSKGYQKGREIGYAMGIKEERDHNSGCTKIDTTDVTSIEHVDDNLDGLEDIITTNINGNQIVYYLTPEGTYERANHYMTDIMNDSEPVKKIVTVCGTELQDNTNQ